jgi:methyl-accepting chemotaxis protein
MADFDFVKAVAAHSDWKRKLTDYLRKHDEKLDPAQVGMDNRCPLGEWIRGDGAKYSKLDEYQTLKKEHALFHTAAADIVRKVNAGQPVGADVALGSSSAFGNHSSAVVLAIMRMKDKAQ